MDQQQLNQERYLRGDTSWPADHCCDGRGVPGEVFGFGPGRVVKDCGPRLPKLRTFCGDTSPPSPLGLRMICTLDAGHEGDHAAQGSDDEGLATWKQQGDTPGKD